MWGFVLSLLCLLVLTENASAWGDTGHRIVCEIAYRVAAPSTRAEIRRLLRQDGEYDFFRDSCIWPDHPRKRRTEHYVNLARTSSGLTSDKCPLADKCVLTAINKDLEELSSSSASDADRLASLKYLGHWVGDLHQPLHVSFEDDRGGNNIRVRGECSGKLHSVWDTCLVILAVGDDVPAAATSLLKKVKHSTREMWTASDPQDWANESFTLAEAAATHYCIKHGNSCDLPSEQSVEMDADYVKENEP